METKTKVSITLSPKVLRAVDRHATVPGQSRSEAIEALLQRGLRMTAEEKMRADTVAYYESLTTEERAEDEAIARASTEGARKRRID